jgi:cell division septation protein DedD
MSYDLGPADPGDDGALGYADEYEDEKPRRRILRPVLVVLVLVLCAWGVWHFAGNGKARSPGDVPLIRADDSATKERPEQPGGMAIPNQDKLVYGEGRGQVEKLLPPPESPIASPAPPPASVAAPGASPAGPPSGQSAAPGPSAAPATATATASPAPAAPAPVAVAPVSPAPVPPAPVPAAPAAPASPTPAAAPVAVAPVPSAPSTASSAGGYRLQLAALRSEEAARKEWERVKGANKDLLGRYGAAWPRADLGSRGVFYRVQVGPIADEAAAERVCGELKRRNIGCILVRP